MRGTIQEGGPESFRKGCWRSSCAVALWDGSLTSIRSRKERNTVDTWRCEQMFEFICLARFEYNIAKKTAVKLTHTHTLLVTTQMSISSSTLGTFRSVTHDFRPVSNHRQPPIASGKCVFPDWLSCFCCHHKEAVTQKKQPCICWYSCGLLFFLCSWEHEHFSNVLQ